MTQPMNVVPISAAAASPRQVLRIPVEQAAQVALKLAPRSTRDQLEARVWQRLPLAQSQQDRRFFSIDLSAAALPDGVYEYVFEKDGEEIADPYATEIARFGGYRGVLRIENGQRIAARFDWSGELNAPLPGNHELVIYELPIHWVNRTPDTNERQVGIGRFEDALFRLLPRLVALGINCIELLPVQDSPDTINWGYGTRFFLAPDIDQGSPNDLKAFIKRCHQLGIRVILDVVMNHAKECPLEQLAPSWYFIEEGEEERGDSWGGRLFRFVKDVPPGSFSAREFLCDVARFWVREYHVDGFRIDEFKGINHWDFLQDFTDAAWNEHSSQFAARPFIVIAEDSWGRSSSTRAEHRGRRVVDAIWDFNARSEWRRLITNRMETTWGEPSRSQRLLAALNGWQSWDDLKRAFQPGFSDMARHVGYLTSHDVEHDGEQRLMNFLLKQNLREHGWRDVSYEQLRKVVDGVEGYRTRESNLALSQALAQSRSAHALLLTSAAIPMLLAGEEFGDVHDLDHSDWRMKMSDPVDFSRAGLPGHGLLLAQLSQLISLRRNHPALCRNEVDLFYTHPELDAPDGQRVFAYCRSAGHALGSSGQVVVVANLSARAYASFWLPWKWASLGSEIAQPATAQPATVQVSTSYANVPLGPFEVRVFSF
jgi:1,4-alpha-glucan branching enzyme